MNAKEIGRRAGRIFEYHLPDQWIFRSQEDQEDYGLDGEIELASDKDHATGFIFKVQIKGQQSVSIIENGTIVSFGLKVERLKYYMREVEIPIILVVVDVTTNRIFWKSLQDDVQLRETLKLALASGQSTVAVHLPVGDSLPERYEELLAAVDGNMNWLRVSALNRITLPVERMIRKSPDSLISEILENSKIVNFHLFSEVFERLYVGGKFDALFEQAKGVLGSATEKVETRFCAGLYIEKVYLQSFDPKSDEYKNLCLKLYLTLLDLVRKSSAEEYIRLYAVILIRSLKMNLLVDADYHYYLSAKIAESDDLTRWVVDVSRSSVVIKAAREVEKVVSAVNRVILSGNKYLLLDVLPRVGSRISLFAHRLSLDGFEEQSKCLYSWLKFCIDFSIDIARGLEYESFIAEILVLNSTYKVNSDDALGRIEESLVLSRGIKSESVRASVVEMVEKIRARLEKGGKDATPEEELNFFRERAKALGFNCDDPDDEFGRIISQGLKDYNPERVLRDCEYLFVFPSGARGVPARMVGLPSAAMKWVFCTKKEYAIGGWDLDNIYDSPVGGFGFKAEYCQKCEYKAPRDREWAWTSKWQNQEMEKYKEIIKKIDS